LVLYVCTWIVFLHPYYGLEFLHTLSPFLCRISLFFSPLVVQAFIVRRLPLSPPPPSLVQLLLRPSFFACQSWASEFATPRLEPVSSFLSQPSCTWLFFSCLLSNVPPRHVIVVMSIRVFCLFSYYCGSCRTPCPPQNVRPREFGLNNFEKPLPFF